MQSGVVNADAALGIFLTETLGSLRVGEVESHRTSGAGTTDVALSTRAGSILPGNADATPEVVAMRIDLGAIGGGIGSGLGDLAINSSSGGTGRVYATATGVDPAHGEPRTS